MEEYIVYVKIDMSEYITAVASSGFLQDAEGWIEVDRGGGQRYYHAQAHYFPQHIRTESGAWRYKLIDDVPTECTLEEIAAQEEALIKPEEPGQPGQSEESVLNIYEELEAAYSEGVNSI